MTIEEFDSIVERRLELIRRTLVTKGREYARGEDRLSNFKKSALLERTTPESSLLGKWGKHLVSVVDFIRDLDSGVTHTEEEWNEKLGDVINYGILLEALTFDRRREKTPSESPRGS